MKFVSRKASSRLVKEMNRKLIIDELKKNPRQSRADIAKKTKLSRPCVSELVREMIEEGLIIEVGVGTSTGGKRPIMLEYNVKSNFVIGAMIEDSSLSVILADMQGDWIATTTKEFYIPTDGYYITNLIAEAVKQLLHENSISQKDILGMAIGIPGITLEMDRKIGYTPGVDWKDISLEDEMKERLGFPIKVDNDVNLMTIGEFYRGNETNAKDIVYLFAGNGVGSGIIIDGKFYRGFHNAAGEIGHMIIGNQMNKIPNMGVFETNYGLLGIREKIKQHGLESNFSNSLIEYLQTHESETAKSLLDDILFHWATAVINLSSILDPQLVILAGEMSKLNATSFEKFKSIVEEYLPKSPKIKITSLGSKAGLHGTVHLALESFAQASFMNK